MKKLVPLNLLTLGDSWSNSGGGYTCYSLYLTGNITVQNLAISAKCLTDPTGATGADTMVATVAADLAASPNSDIVSICTGGQNDMVRLSRNQNTLTLADMQTAMASMIDAIFAAGKRAVTLGVAINSTIRTEVNGATATAVTTNYNLWLANYAKQRNFGFVDPTLLTDSGGLKTIYNFDGSHLNQEGNVTMATMPGGFNAIFNAVVRKRSA